MPEFPAGFDFMNKESLDKMWFKTRDKLKDSKFLQKLDNFDIRQVSVGQVDLITKLFANDVWMKVQWIQRESVFATYLFQWVNKIIEYLQLTHQMKALGMKELEIERDLLI